ncbi:branched-chain amino acid ABC transporter permease [Halorarum halobium]|uniref:branched-chain amino acid ABC transporter permease n=1 Tax=Halorarum halobium TaxID=3075121 RepID=UPI0028AD066C|nr:branched-chain amino acid ABC transporter permease [Halobaculum sp. XH14]
MVDPVLVANQILTGLSIGSRLFLVAVGLTLIFGVLDVLNFTHGVLYMIGAYVAIQVVTGLVGNFWVALVVAALVVGLIGVVLESVFIRRVYDREPLDQLLLTFAFVLILTDLVRITFGSLGTAIQEPDVFNFTVQFTGNVGISGYRLFVIALSILTMAALFFTLQRTNIGRMVRATSSDRDMARLLGIDVPKLYTGVFFVGAVLAGLAGGISAPLQAVTTEAGNQVIIQAFVITVIGGLGSFVGAFIGAYLIGILIAVGSLWITGGGQLFPFVAMILVLVLKPQGLFGEAVEA